MAIELTKVAFSLSINAMIVYPELLENQYVDPCSNT